MLALDLMDLLNLIQTCFSINLREIRSRLLISNLFSRKLNHILRGRIHRLRCEVYISLNQHINVSYANNEPDKRLCDIAKFNSATVAANEPISFVHSRFFWAAKRHSNRFYPN